MQKARRHPVANDIGLRPLVGARFQVLFHSPNRGSFHLSLALLLHYRSPRSTQPCGVGPADSRQVPRDWRYSGNPPEVVRFRLRGCHSLWPAFPSGSANTPLCHSVTRPQPCPRLPRHPVCNACGLTHTRFRLFPFRSPLLGESRFLSFPAGT